MTATAPTPREQILQLFRRQAGGVLSGEEICRTLGISRTAVWKHIRALREQGYEIAGVASQGYRLCQAPNRLLAETVRAGLETYCVGRQVVVHDCVGSTNAEAQRLADEGAPEGTLVLAEQQTGGRGRLGRQWESPPGVNLYASVILRPPLPPQQACQLTFLSAVAVARALETACGVTAEVKWPNDLLLDGRKVAGLLNEMQAEVERVHAVILGIGVNLNMTADQFPAELRYPATSVLLSRGTPVDRNDFVRALCRQLDSLYQVYLRDGARPIMAAWQASCGMLGQRVQVTGGTEVVGLAVGVDDDGALRVRSDAGEERRVLSGDVRPL